MKKLNIIDYKEVEYVFHGSRQCTVKDPTIIIKNKNIFKDFGFAFYITNNLNQARKWATKKQTEHSAVSVYELNRNAFSNYKYIKFTGYTDEWLEFVVNCRSGQEHSYDIIEGPMVDDTIWDFLNAYITEKITKETFMTYCKFKYTTHQIAICNKDIMKDVIRFVGIDENITTTFGLRLKEI